MKKSYLIANPVSWQNVQNDTGRLATSVAKERELSTKLVAELAKNIAVFKNTPMNITARDDP